MNKFLASALTLTLLSVSCSSFASSTIAISVPSNNTIAAKADIEIPLNSLTNDVPYMVTCDLDSSSPSKLDMSFAPRLAPNGGFGVAKLNGKPVLKNVGSLQSGQNTFSFMVSVMANDKSKSNVMIMKNLDDRFSASVKTCQAQPVTNVVAAANRMAGGYFYITNHLPYYVDISVGNYFQTDYCIYPYSKAYIEVTTGYQNIDIVGTHY